MDFETGDVLDVVISGEVLDIASENELDVNGLRITSRLQNEEVSFIY
jgi:hypothetical protein